MKCRNPRSKFFDCWSASEQGLKNKCNAFKGKLFFPLIWLFESLGITANMVSCLSAIFGIAAAVFLWHDLGVSAAMLAVSLVLDCIDGSMSRAAKNSSTKGAMVDALTDHVTTSATAIGFVSTGLLNPVIGGAYLALYPPVLIFSAVRNFLNVPALYTLRPRLIVHLFFFVYVFTSVNALGPVVLVFSAVLLYEFLRDFCLLLRMVK